MVEVDSILDPEVEPRGSLVAKAPKWCQYFFLIFFIDHGLTGETRLTLAKENKGTQDTWIAHTNADQS
jgi:hypothetical protein